MPNNLRQAQNLVKDLNATILKAEQAEARVTIAKNQYEELEDRNKQIRQNQDQELEVYKQNIIKDIELQTKELKDEVTKLKNVKKELIVEISDAEMQKQETTKELDEYTEQLELLKDEIVKTTSSYEEMSDLVVQTRDTLGKLTNQVLESTTQIQELARKKFELDQDIELLSREVDNLEYKVIERDADYKARVDETEAQLKDKQDQLKKASIRLVEAQNEDNKIRESWAEEHLKLDKRIKVVRRLEGRLNDAEARIQELDNYSKL